MQCGDGINNVGLKQFAHAIAVSVNYVGTIGPMNCLRGSTLCMLHNDRAHPAARQCRRSGGSLVQWLSRFVRPWSAPFKAPPCVIAAGRSCLEDYRLMAEDQASPAPSKARRSYRDRLKRVPPVLTPFQRFVCIPPLVLGLQHRSSLCPKSANLTKSEDHFRQA